jgi:hypothetical protein
MRCLRTSADLKTTYGLFQYTIRFRHPLVLAQMLEPGIHIKSLDEAALDGRILENAPIVGTVAPTLAGLSRESV